MPKQTKIQKKASAKFELDLERLNEIVKKKGHEEKSELEKEVLISENEIDTQKFQDFWQGVSLADAPTLNQIANAPRIVASGLVRRPETQGGESNQDEADPNKYQVGGPSKDEVKYIQTTVIRTTPEIVDTRELGMREFRPETSGFFMQSSESRQRDFTSQSVEKYVDPKGFDPSKERRDPFKKEEIKYEFKQSGA